MTTQLLKSVAEPILINGLLWSDFKATKQLLDRPRVQLSF
jgi:hypothetical protein